MALHCRSFLTQKDSILAEQETADYNVQSFCFSPSGIALLLSPLDDGSENKSNEVFAAWCGIDAVYFTCIKKRHLRPMHILIWELPGFLLRKPTELPGIPHWRRKTGSALLPLFPALMANPAVNAPTGSSSSLPYTGNTFLHSR